MLSGPKQATKPLVFEDPPIFMKTQSVPYQWEPQNFSLTDVGVVITRR